ncbi:MAG: hypothetical protein AAF489_12050 [Bacteroidota bacterium]
MKKIMTIVTLLLIAQVSQGQEDEKRIKFNKGTLKICSTSHFKISGYDGDEVIIKSLNNETRYFYNFNYGTQNKVKTKDSVTVSGYRFLTNVGKEKELEKGLKPLGNKLNDPNEGYLDISEHPGELWIRDLEKSNQDGVSYKILGFVNKYEIMIPNSIKLLWNTENCSKTNSDSFYVTSGSKPWELSNFKGEVEISSLYSSINLTDVSGPVIANTIGGNIKVIFDKVAPTRLYSLISNNGYIDIELPTTANLNIDAIGSRVLSDIEFKVLYETIENGSKTMELQLNSGGTKMGLDAASGSIYIRKN